MNNKDYWFPIVSDEDREKLRNIFLYTNILRLRLISWPLIAIQLFISPIIVKSSYYGFITMIVLVGLLLIFQVTSTLPRSPEGLTPLHKLYDLFIIPFILVVYVIYTSLFMLDYLPQQPIPPVMGIMIAMFGSAAFFYIPLHKSVLMYALTSGVLIFLSWTLMPSSIALANTINMIFVAVLSIMMSKMIYVLGVQDYLKQRIIERQKNDLLSANQMLYTLSYIDSLTNIPNRRYFDEVLNKEFSRAVRDDSDLALLMIDIDNFKKYNDLFGHQQGDECLKKVAETLTNTVNRPGDIVARYGGEEFAVVLPSTDLSGACQIADKLCQAIRDMNIVYPCPPLNQLTISLGMACRKPSTNSPERLITLADKALYEAKSVGGNTYFEG